MSDKKETILAEAERLVHGDRGTSYGHPLDDMTRTAEMVSGLLRHKLSSPLVAEDIAKIMITVKLSRETNSPKRDNRVDLAGYAEALDMIVEERVRRGETIVVACFCGDPSCKLGPFTGPPSLPASRLAA